MNTMQNGTARKVITLLTFASIISAPVIGQNIVLLIEKATAKKMELVSKELKALNTEKNESTASVVL